MFCTKCGHKNPDNGNFCTRCGNPLIKPKKFNHSEETTSINEESFNIKDNLKRESEALVKDINQTSEKFNEEKNIDSLNNAKEETNESIYPQNQYDEEGNLILPVYDDPKKSKVGIIIGIVVAAIITAGGILSYHYFVESIALLSPYIKSKPEIEVKNLINKFIDLAQKNDLEGLKDIYPGIFNADSISFNNATINNISIESNNSSGYIVNFPEFKLIIESTEEGFKIKDSKDFFAYPLTKKEIAMKTGLWDDTMEDIGLSYRMHDDGFWRYMENKFKLISPDIIQLGETDDLEITLINTTDKPIKGENYEVEYELYNRVIRNVMEDDYGYEYYDYEYESEISTKPGKDIEPYGQVKYDHWGGSGEGELVKRIIYKMSPQEKEIFYNFTGKEYDDYISKKH